MVETSEIQLSKVRVSQVGDMIKILSLEYADVEHKTFENIAKIISEEFNVICTQRDVEKYYEIDEYEDFEKESRIVEYNI